MKGSAPRGFLGQLTAEQSNSIHRENISKEERYLDVNRTDHFQLNPNHVYILPEKPNSIRPQDLKREKASKNKPQQQNEDIFGNHYTDDPVEEAFSNEKLERTLKSVTLVPRQKYDMPLTRNQEIGWFHQQLNIPKNTKESKIEQCDITKFADNYYQMTKFSPYSNKGGFK
ncbi:hypothetical protein PPERSA_06997 [Pseudocohnilembus persalinus]|uniref:Uncharacterized protein n=1 Tax=Pseudocohnilembus persalinus TaxID=266149 RepID=A0A0V0QYP1_PSEPJ|nr:hypothetical protein PPERSA_06997 [Pseudocohnilembus persalinus]|eukprot:KRX07382.1 hypothetical protein PPERSA_06997 [Pseudocohnilembus persalinus]